MLILGCSAARGLEVVELLEGSAHTRITGVTCPVTIVLSSGLSVYCLKIIPQFCDQI